LRCITKFFSLREFYTVSPLGFVGALATGLSHSAVFGYGAIYASSINLSLFEISLYMMIITSAGALSQWPIGYLSDRIDRRVILIGVSFMASGLSLFFVFLSLPSAIILISYFLAHRYDGIRLWNFQGNHFVFLIVWFLTAISFLFLYPATYNLLEIPSVLKPKVRIYGTGIMRITRHPQAFGQIIWCFAHTLWIGTSFTLITSIGLILHHLFAIWHGDKRLSNRFGEEFEKFKKNTSIIPFMAILEGRQEFRIKEFFRLSQLGILITEERNDLITRFDHALYLGRELQKAEECLYKKLPYIQD